MAASESNTNSKNNIFGFAINLVLMTLEITDDKKIKTVFKNSSRRKIDLVIYADASFTGWCITEWKITSGDRWRENETRHKYFTNVLIF